MHAILAQPAGPGYAGYWRDPAAHRGLWRRHAWIGLPLGPLAPSQISPQMQKGLFVQALGQWLMHHADTQPAMVVMEDLHWADPTTLEWLAPQNPAVVWAFLMPNALMEESIFKAAPPAQMARTHVYQLPDSSPQTLWFILMEQLGKLSAMDALALQQTHNFLQTDDMSSNLKQCMDAAMTIDGAQAVALVDYRSGMCLAQAGGGMNLDLAAAGNTEVVRAKLKTMEMLGLRRGIEDILITLGDQYHLIRLVPNNLGLFLYLVLDKAKGNLALARGQVAFYASTPAYKPVLDCHGWGDRRSRRLRLETKQIFRWLN